LIGKSEGRGVVDIASAAKDALGSKVSSDWLIAGHSQGGQSGLFAGSLAPKAAPKLHLKGVVAYAPASNVLLQRVAVPNLTDAKWKGLTGLAVMILDSAAREAGITTSKIVNPGPAALLPQIEKVCLSQLGAAEMFGQWTPSEILKPGIKTPEINAVLGKMNPDVHIGVPVLILQGLDDTTVLPTLTNKLDESLRKHMAKNLTYEKFAGLTHQTIVTDAASEGVASTFIDNHLR
jgi:pimeloyl-ACP methyl ester carboxylesterase